VGCTEGEGGCLRGKGWEVEGESGQPGEEAAEREGLHRGWTAGGAGAVREGAIGCLELFSSFGFLSFSGSENLCQDFLRDGREPRSVGSCDSDSDSFYIIKLIGGLFCISTTANVNNYAADINLATLPDTGEGIMRDASSPGTAIDSPEIQQLKHSSKSVRHTSLPPLPHLQSSC